MNQRIELSISVPLGKLSAPVEVLTLGKRTQRALQRASIYTVAEIVLSGKPNLSAVKGVGSLTANRVFEAVSWYLGLPEEQLAEEAHSLLGTCWNPWAAPVQALGLPDPYLQELTRKGFFQVRQLIQARTAGYAEFLWMNAMDIDAINRALNEYLGGAARLRLLRCVGTDPSLVPSSIRFPVLTLPLPRLGDGAWSTLEQCSMRFLSLELMDSFGFRRQGTFQSIQRAHEHVRENMGILCIFLDYFEERSSRFRDNMGTGPLELETLVRHLLPDPAASDLILDEKEVERMIVLIRILVLYFRTWVAQEIEPRWPVLLRMSCLVEPALTVHEPLRQIRKEQGQAGTGVTDYFSGGRSPSLYTG